MADDIDVAESLVNPPVTVAKDKKSKPVCRFYAKSGFCKFEEKCRFFHTKSDDKIDDKKGASTEAINEQKTEVSLEKETSCNNDDNNTKKKRCRFFNTRGGCARGDNCKFAHIRKMDEDKEEKTTTKPKITKPKTAKPKTPATTSAATTTTSATAPAVVEASAAAVVETTTAAISSNTTVSSKQVNSKRVLPTTEMLSALDDDQLSRLRTREIDQMMRRFGKNKTTEIPSSVGTSFSVNFTPSDPDWPFDIENIILEVTFPHEYPKKIFDAGLSQDQALPSDLINFVNQGITKWTQQQQQVRDKKDTVDLPFRPFLRWFDRNVEKLFIGAAKQMKENEDSHLHQEQSLESSSSEEDIAAQEEYPIATNAKNIDPNPTRNPTRHLKPSNHHSHTSNSNTERKDILLSDFMTFKNQPSKNKVASHPKSTQHGDVLDTSKKDHIVFVDRESTEPVKDSIDDSTCDDSVQSDCVELPSLEDTISNDSLGDGKPRGTEIRFKGLELSENTSTLRTETVTLTVECLKCKTKTDMKTDKSRPASLRCEKCTCVLRVVFRSSMIHHHSMPTLGYLDLQGCHPFDLVMADSSLIAGCLACSSETLIKGAQYGANQVWCSKCHQKLQFKIESTRFFQLLPTGTVLDGGHIPMPKRKPRAPGLREGFPLPDNGTCKHYKKSFRWLRFPCCGKCYPCDVCHEEQESHETKYANRMVCGFCSKEQPFSQGICTACKSSTTKAKTTHWEGGRGCRNKTLMSRGDDKKFKNTSKTISRKSQAKATPGKAK